MAKSKFVREWQERREAERRRQREEESRRSVLERRQEEQREQQREEERREERRQEARELDASLSAQRAAREALLAQYRARKREERRILVRKVEQRAVLLETLRAATRQRGKSEREESAAAEGSDRRPKTTKDTARQSPARNAERTQQKKRQQKALSEERSSAAKTRDAAPGKAREGDEDPSRAQPNAGKARDEPPREKLRERSRAMRKAADSERERGAGRRRAAQEMRREQAQGLARREEARDAARMRRGKTENARDRDQEERRRRSREMRAESEQPRSRAAARDLPPTTPQLPERATHGGDRKKATAEVNTLRGRIPSGSLSGDLPWLRVRGNGLTSLEGAPVILHGVSVLELDDAPTMAAARGNRSRMDEILAWNPSVIRLAITRTRVLAGAVGNNGPDYLEALDQIVARAAAAGAYTMLSLRRLDEETAFGTTLDADGDAKSNFVAPQPDYDAIGMWRMLGERYADEPAVLFDLYSTPHPALPDDLTGMYSEWELWRLWVRLAVADLRRVHPRALCFVAGLDWATDLSGFPLLGTDDQPIANLVYAAHMHARRRVDMPPLRALARRHPVFITELSAADIEVAWSERTATLLQAERIGWTAAHWTGDTPLCTTGRCGEPVPTRFGSVVRRSLAMASRSVVALHPSLNTWAA